MCANHGKAFKDWKKTKSAQAYLKALAESLTTSHKDYCPTDLIISTVGGSEGSQTWAHPLVAIKVARWISPASSFCLNTKIPPELS